MLIKIYDRYRRKNENYLKAQTLSANFSDLANYSQLKIRDPEIN